MINVRKLYNELKVAGIPVDGCDEKGKIDFKLEATAEQKELAKKILAVHNPVWYLEERRKAYPPTGDSIDILYKVLYYMDSKGIDIGIEGKNWINDITKIKNDFPGI